jgi:hypothetical protein
MACLQVALKMKSRHVAGTITKKKKSKWQANDGNVNITLSIHGTEV